MASDVQQIGQYLASRGTHPDTADSPFSSAKDFLEHAVPEELASVNFRYATTDVVPFEPAPTITPVTFGDFLQPAPSIHLASPPRGPVVVPDPPRTQPAGPQPSQQPGSPSALPNEPAPPPSVPAVLPPPPSFGPKQNAALPAPPNFAPNPNATLPPPPNFAPSAQSPSGPIVGPVVPPSPPPFGVTPPAVPGPYAPNGVPTNDVLGSLKLVDDSVKRFLGILSKDGQFSPLGSAAPGNLIDEPTVNAKNLANIGSQLGTTGLAKFSGEQLTLFLMNRDGQAWSPSTIYPAAAPGSAGILAATVDGTAGLGHEFKVNNGLDRQLQLSKGAYNDFQAISYPPFVAAIVAGGLVNPGNAILSNMPPRLVGAASQDTSLVDDPTGLTDPTTIGLPLVQASMQTKNLYTDDSKYEAQNAGAFFSLDQLVKDSLKGSDNAKLLVSDPAVANRPRVDIKRLYVPRQITLGGTEFRPSKPPLQIGAGAGAGGGSDGALQRSYFPGGIVPADMTADNDSGFILTNLRSGDPRDGSPGKGGVDDDDAYVPLSFMDLRPLNTSNKVRTVYFRPFISNLSEEISPEWGKANYFGRVDAVASYQSTARVVHVSFMVHAFAPDDLLIIYRKLNWLVSMCYPSYDKDLLFRSGPIVRLRVGDVFKTKGGFGLPGIIESLSIDYSDMIWELQKDSKVPMGARVSVSFLVLHEVPIGLGLDGKFGGLGKIDQNTGKFVPPNDVQQTVDSNDTGPEVESASTFRGFGDDINDYDLSR